MPPTEEEISKFDALRENVIKNDAARGFLEARQTIDELRTPSIIIWACPLTLAALPLLKK